jgi:protein SCO1/2
MNLLFCWTWLAFAFAIPGEETALPSGAKPAPARTFAGRGVLRGWKAETQTAVVAHEAIPGYMDAMTMPFRVRNPAELSGLKAGDQFTFQLQVTDTESWINHIARTGSAAAETSQPARNLANAAAETKPVHPLRYFHFTNELGQAVSLEDFRGQALAITFFFTRCPVPDFCPRLSKNFQQASRKLLSLPNSPTNWHFLSVSFDTAFDTPAVLKAYAQGYGYNPAHWSFLTGPEEKIRELASLSDVKFDREGALFNHNFRTLIIDAAGRLQMAFPVGGDLSDAIATEMLKAAVATNGLPAGR